MQLDHHLQVSIINKLTAANKALTFSELKDQSIDNSLFNYHLSKLIARNLIEKRESGYVLSVEGARWLNANSNKLKQSRPPRVYIAVVIHNNEGKFLIGERTGQLKVINDYMLPSVKYTDEFSLQHQIDMAIKTFTIDSDITSKLDFGFMQIIAEYSDGATMRSLFYIVRCEIVGNEVLKEYYYATYDWMGWEDLTKIHHPSVTILKKIIEYSGNAANIHASPVITG